jgi:hypothetical protein
VTGPLLALGVAAAGVGASVLGQVPLAIAVALAQILLVVGWFLVLDVPGREVGGLLAIGAGITADVAMLDRGSDISLGPLAGVLGPALVLALIHQFARTDKKGRVTASLTATMTAITLSVVAAALVAERAATHGQTVTVVAIVSAGVASAVVAAPVPAAFADGIALGAGLAAGAGAGAIAGDMDAGYVVAVAFGATVLAVLGRRAATFTAYDVAAEAERVRVAAAGAPVATGRAANRQARRQAARQARRSGEAVLVMASALPLVLAAPAAYVLGRLLVG